MGKPQIPRLRKFSKGGGGLGIAKATAAIDCGALLASREPGHASPDLEPER